MHYATKGATITAEAQTVVAYGKCYLLYRNADPLAVIPMADTGLKTAIETIIDDLEFLLDEAGMDPTAQVSLDLHMMARLAWAAQLPEEAFIPKTTAPKRAPMFEDDGRYYKGGTYGAGGYSQYDDWDDGHGFSSFPQGRRTYTAPPPPDPTISAGAAKAVTAEVNEIKKAAPPILDTSVITPDASDSDDAPEVEGFD
jgi:hypothetical protein